MPAGGPLGSRLIHHRGQVERAVEVVRRVEQLGRNQRGTRQFGGAYTISCVIVMVGLRLGRSSNDQNRTSAAFAGRSRG